MEEWVFVGGVYRHFKGKYYIVEGVAKDCDTGEHIVVYRALYGDGQLWTRKLSEFNSEVDRQKYPDADQIRRFKHVESFSE